MEDWMTMMWHKLMLQSMEKLRMLDSDIENFCSGVICTSNQVGTVKNWRFQINHEVLFLLVSWKFISRIYIRYRSSTRACGQTQDPTKSHWYQQHIAPKICNFSPMKRIILFYGRYYWLHVNEKIIGAEKYFLSPIQTWLECKLLKILQQKVASLMLCWLAIQDKLVLT